MNDIVAVKDIDFQGAVLKAVQDINKIIWVGVSWVCNGIGLNKDQKDRQVKNIQKDSVLKKGCVKFDAGVFDPNNETLAIQLDYLPLWLCKISITPKMMQETPEVAKRLERYQLKAKDVLSAAFIHKQETIQPRKAITPVEKFFDAQYALLERQEKSMNEFMNTMTKSFQVLSNLLIDQQNKSKPAQQPGDNQEPKQIGSITFIQRDWKNEMYKLAKQVAAQNPDFESSYKVLSYIYRNMQTKYGFVSQQVIKEYNERYHFEPSYVSVIDAVSDDEKWRSIFESMLRDMVEDKTNQLQLYLDPMDSMIKSLANKLNNHTPNSCTVYRLVYQYMEDNMNVSWKNLVTRYKSKNCTNCPPRKKVLILENKNLYGKFEKAVKELLKEVVE